MTTTPHTWSVPLLVGDGVHDDTAALQYRLDYGPPVVGGTYAVHGTLHVYRDTPGVIRHATLLARRPHDGHVTVYVHSDDTTATPWPLQQIRDVTVITRPD